MNAPLTTDERAFPSSFSLPENVGLTKRELFAAMAMQGMCANEKYDDWTYEGTAKSALSQADALLAALKDATP